MDWLNAKQTIFKLFICVCAALAVAIAIDSAGYYFVLPAFTKSLLAYVATVAGVIGAFAAAWAAQSAGEAARAAIAIDESNRRRLDEREKRDSRPLAIAIQIEAAFATRQMNSFPSLVDELVKTLGPVQAVVNLKNTAETYTIPTAKKHIDKLGCFSHDDGAAIARALALSERFAFPLRDIPIYENNVDLANIVLDSLLKHSKPYAAIVFEAVKSLEHLTSADYGEFPGGAPADVAFK